MKASKGANKKAAAKGGGGGPSGDTAAAPVSTAGQRQEPVHNTRRSKKGPKVPDKEKPALSKKAAAAAAAAAAPAAAASSDAAAHSGDDGVPGGGKGSGGDGGGAPKTKGGRGGGRAKAKAKAKPAGALQGAASRSYSRHDGAPKLPHYESGRATWDAEETRTLHEGLRRYPPQHHSNMTIYVKIAAMLPRKTVRDVAAEVWKLRRRMHDTAHQAALPLEDGRGGKRQRVGQGPEDGGSAYPPTLVHAPVSGPHLLDRHMENRLQQLLGDNVMIQGKMRDHLAASRLDDNIPLMAKFYDNIAAMQALMDSLPERMPPLDVQVNTTLLNRPPPPPLPHGQQQNGANFAQPMMMAVDPVNVRDAAGAHGYAMASGAAAGQQLLDMMNPEAQQQPPAHATHAGDGGGSSAVQFAAGPGAPKSEMQQGQTGS